MKKRYIFLVIAVVIIIVVFFVTGKRDSKNINDNTDNNSSISKSQHNHMKINSKKYYSMDSYIMYLPSMGMYRNHVELEKQNEIQSAVRFFNELNIIPLGENYEYKGGDSPAAWTYLYYDDCNKNLADQIRFYEDLDHSIIIRSYIDSEYKYYKIDTIEYEKLKNFFESYDN